MDEDSPSSLDFRAEREQIFHSIKDTNIKEHRDTSLEYVDPLTMFPVTMSTDLVIDNSPVLSSDTSCYSEVVDASEVNPDNKFSNTISSTSEHSISESSESQQKTVIQIGTAFLLESETTPSIIMSGLVVKRASGLLSNWKVRYQVLYSNKVIAYFKKGASKPLKSLALQGASFCLTDELKQKQKCLKIIFKNSEKQPCFYFYNENLSELLRWKESLISAGVIFIDVLYGQKDELRDTKVSDWNVDYVIAFLHQISIPPTPVKYVLQEAFQVSASLTQEKATVTSRNDVYYGRTYGEHYGHLFKEYEIDGSILSTEINDEMLYTMGMMNNYHREYLMRFITHLSRNRYYRSIDELYFTLKIESFLVTSFTADYYQLLLNSLIDTRLIFSTYLSDDSTVIPQILEQLLDHCSSEQKQLKKFFQPVNCDDIAIAFFEQVTWTSIEYFLHPVLIKENSRPFPLLKNSKIGEIGKVHAVLIVGGWILDWNQSSVIVPRRICQGMIGRIILSGMYKIGTIFGRQMEKVLEAVAGCVCHYNVNYNHHLKRRNSFHFISEVLMALDISPSSLQNEHVDLYNLLEEIQIYGETTPKRIVYKMSSIEYNSDEINDINGIEINSKEVSNKHIKALPLKAKTQKPLLKRFNSKGVSRQPLPKNQIEKSYATITYFPSFLELNSYAKAINRDSTANEKTKEFIKMLSRVYWLRHVDEKQIFQQSCNETGLDLLSSYSKS